MTKIIFLYIIFLHTNLFAQSIIHPLKLGFGYHYAHSLHEEYDVSAHNIYFSSGKFDLYTSFSFTTIPRHDPGIYPYEEKIKSYSMGMNFVSVREDKSLMPAFGVFIASVSDVFCVGLGPSVAFELYDYNHIRIVPEAGAAITFFDVAGDNFIGGAEAAFGINLNTVIVFDYFAFTISPGYSVGEDISFFNFSAGVSFTPPMRENSN